MSTGDIVSKLTQELSEGISSEAEVVYLLSQIRKLMERDQIEDKYVNLKFHCDWTLHSHLRGETAHQILRLFDAAYPALKGMKTKLQEELPDDLRRKLDKITEMQSFQAELETVLAAYGLPPLTIKYSDGWLRFLYLYAKVIEDIPLEVQASRQDAAKNLAKVVLKLRRTLEKIQIPFRVDWEIHDKSGNVFAISTFKQSNSASEAGSPRTA